MKIDKFVFDLDRTIWDTYDITGRPIWAKQMLPPYEKAGDKIMDDVGSYCVLRTGFRDYIQDLSDRGVKIGFISVGAIKDYEDEFQPSIQMLKIFGIYDLFNSEKVLAYKKESKLQHLRNCKVCYYFDDDEKYLSDAKEVKDVSEFDSKEITDWKLFNERERL